MQIATNAALPDAVKGAMPEEAQTLFRTIFNAYDQCGVAEADCFYASYDSLWRAGWSKKADGSYFKVDRGIYKVGRVISASNMDKLKAMRAQMAQMHEQLCALETANGDTEMGEDESPLGKLTKPIGKRHDDGGWDMQIPVAKASDDDARLVFGWLSVAKTADGKRVVDMEGDVVEPEELEKAVYDYVLNSRNAGELHTNTEGIGTLVESVVLTKEKQASMGIPEGCVPEGWWVGYHITDDVVWKKVKNGTYKMFSIGGSGTRTEEEE